MKRLISPIFAAAVMAATPAAACKQLLIDSPTLLLVGNKGENTVSFIDLETGREVSRRPVSASAPHEIAVAPGGGLAAVVNYGDAAASALSQVLPGFAP